MTKKKYTHVLWDYNGTIIDDIGISIDSVNVLLAERGLPVINRAEYRAVFDFPVSEYYEKLGFDFSKEPYSVIAPIWIAEYNRRWPTPRVYPGVREVMGELKHRGLRQEILSACELEMLTRQIEILDIGKYLDDWQGLDNIHAASKEDLARGWRQQNPDAVALMIGDTTHDAHVARVMGTDCLLFDGGHMTRERLLTCDVPVISRFEEVLDFVE